MINKKLLSFDRKALRYVGLNVLFQWLGMLCNVVLVMTVSRLIGGVFADSLTGNALWQGMLLCLLTVPCSCVKRQSIYVLAEAVPVRVR